MLMNKQIAIDGPAASGKTAVGKTISNRLDWSFLDTGLMYRAATKLVLDNNADIYDSKTTLSIIEKATFQLEMNSTETKIISNGIDYSNLLRTPEIDANVSILSKYTGVRKILVKHQQKMAVDTRIVMVGRDITTVVLPNAFIKIYLDASLNERALRRYKESQTQTVEQIKYNISIRDTYDKNRNDSPLLKSKDAWVINTTEMTVESVSNLIISKVNK
jgi:cytidylate kinase